MFDGGFVERRDLEQYFWTEKTIQGIKFALQSTFDGDSSLCLCTPTVAHYWWMEDGIGVSLLDLDTRFEYLPKFRYFDLRFPHATDLEPEASLWRVIVFDPPFFYIPMDVLHKARTNFPLEYAHVKSNKWTNYAMYSNVDLPGIKRFK
ncbi:hypothetical protein Bhyg_16929, partial [Pseudolycoriella hygida]